VFELSALMKLGSPEFKLMKSSPCWGTYWAIADVVDRRHLGKIRRYITAYSPRLGS
jgi:hypothetical protein